MLKALIIITIYAAESIYNDIIKRFDFIEDKSKREKFGFFNSKLA